MKGPAVKKEFKHFAPEANKVSLVGDFNNWKIDAHPMRKNGTGHWSITINLPPGKYEYKFFVDNIWTNDLNAEGYVPNGWGTENCVIHVKEEE